MRIVIDTENQGSYRRTFCVDSYACKQTSAVLRTLRGPSAAALPTHSSSYSLHAAANIPGHPPSNSSSTYL